MNHQNQQSKRLHIVSLGCPKARVDSELIAGLAFAHGWQLTHEAHAADIIVINTCGFLQSAIEESIDHILEAVEYKSNNTDKGSDLTQHPNTKPQIVVTGCLPSRYGIEVLKKELPEVDYFFDTHHFTAIEKLFEPTQQSQNTVPAKLSCHHDTPSATFEKRRLAQPQSYAYLKISEGCDRQCAFCVIPQIRGKQVSRSINSLVREAQQLADFGVVELVLVAQELTHYGADIGLKNGLLQLLDKLEKIEKIRWIRLMYAYPWGFDERLIQRLGTGKILPYIDIPLQHVSQPILKAMRRNVTEKKQRQLIEKLRSHDEMTIRTSMIVGFPGESDEDFQALCRWIEEIQFDRLGVFTFCAEESTPAANMPMQIDEKCKEERYHEIMRIQQNIQAKKMQALIGKQLTVLVDGISPEHELVTQARYHGQAPEVDGVVFLSDEFARFETPRMGQFVDVEITEASEYDVVGEILSQS